MSDDSRTAKRNIFIILVLAFLFGILMGLIGSVMAVEVVIRPDVTVVGMNDTFLIKTNVESTTFVCGSMGNFTLKPAVTFNLTEQHCPVLSAYENLTLQLQQFNLTSVLAGLNDTQRVCNVSLDSSYIVDQTSASLEGFKTIIIDNMNNLLATSSRELVDMNASLQQCSVRLQSINDTWRSQFSAKETEIGIIRSDSSMKNYLIVVGLLIIGSMIVIEIGGFKRKFKSPL